MYLGLLNKSIKASKDLASPRGRDKDGNNNAQQQNPVDDFVNMENDLAADLCASVDSALSSLKKVGVCFVLVFDAVFI